MRLLLSEAPGRNRERRDGTGVLNLNLLAHLQPSRFHVQASCWFKSVWQRAVPGAAGSMAMAGELLPWAAPI